jgi:hypothetical protein
VLSCTSIGFVFFSTQEIPRGRLVRGLRTPALVSRRQSIHTRLVRGEVDALRRSPRGDTELKRKERNPREDTNAPLGFHGSSRAHWTPTEAWCFSRHMSPISGQSDSWAGACQREKISPARARADVPNFVYVAIFLDGRPRRRTLPTTRKREQGVCRAAFLRALSPPEPPTTKDGNINPFPFRRAGGHTHEECDLPHV